MLWAPRPRHDAEVPERISSGRKRCAGARVELRRVAHYGVSSRCLLRRENRDAAVRKLARSAGLEGHINLAESAVHSDGVRARSNRHLVEQLSRRAVDHAHLRAKSRRRRRAARYIVPRGEEIPVRSFCLYARERVSSGNQAENFSSQRKSGSTAGERPSIASCGHAVSSSQSALG